jgi:hypothetical protein
MFTTLAQAQPVPTAPPTAPPSAPTVPAPAGDLLRLTWEGGGLKVHLGWVLLTIAVVVALAWFIPWILRTKPWQRRQWEFVEAELTIANLGKVKVRPDHENVRIAYHAWVELTTRKAALPFDEEHDVIGEVYASWYKLFGTIRELIKSVPAHRLRDCENTQRLVDTLSKVLNDGLRPHLTRWRSHFNRWYEQTCKNDACVDKRPQDIERGFPQYKELVTDLKKVNEGLREYAAFLKRVADGGK